MGTITHFPEAHERSTEIGLGSRRELWDSARNRILHIKMPVGAKAPPECHVHITKRIIVLEGCACITLQNGTKRVLEGEDTIIPLGILHRIENNGRIPLEILEVRTGTYVGDDDILEM